MANLVASKAPYKRGTRLVHTCPRHGTKTPVTYKRWMGEERGALIVVAGPNGVQRTVHVSEVALSSTPGAWS